MSIHEMLFIKEMFMFLFTCLIKDNGMRTSYVGDTLFLRLWIPLPKWFPSFDRFDLRWI